MRRILLFAFSLVLIVSCKDNIGRQLDIAESCIGSRPNSALAVLLAIPQSDLKTREDVARHALLLSLAYDKSYIDIQSDSLARIAVDYYSGKKCCRERMLAWYSLGIVLKNAKSYIPSMLSFENAEKDALELDEFLYLGLINRNKAVLYSETNNNPASIECYRNAVDYFEKANAPIYKIYSEVSLATAYSNNRDYKMADSLLNDVMRHSDNPQLLALCRIRLASVYVKKDTLPEESVRLYRSSPKTLYGTFDFAYYALAFESMGQGDSANYWLSGGYTRCEDRADSAVLDYLKSKIEFRRGHWSSAYSLIDQATTTQDSLTRVLLEQSISAAQRDYYKNEASLGEERIHRLRDRIVAGIVLILITMALFVSVVVSQNRKKDRLLQEQMARLALEERDLDRVKKENAQLVGSLFNDKIGRLEELNDLYFQGENEKQKERVFRQIKHAVASMQKDQTLFPSLEKDLDRYCNGIMSKFRQQVPSIKRENQLHTVMLFFAGFSYPVVQLIMNKPSVESLKMDRSRLRKEILSSGAVDTELFLTMLEIRKRPQTGIDDIV